MVKLIFYGGVNEIGGNKILLQDKKTRVMFDFGQSFTFGANYFTGYLAPRAVNGLGDYFAFDLLPRIDGLYSKEMLTYCDLPYCQPKIDAVFLSHAHFDHVSHLEFLDPEIPVFMGYGTKLFMESMEETSSFCSYGDHACNRFRTGDKMVFAAHYSRDIDRFNSFYKVAKKTNRKLVISPKVAYLLTKLLGDEHLAVPDPSKDDNILVYYKRKKTGSFDDKDYYLWERAFMNRMVTYEYVRRYQKNLIMDLDFYQFTELMDINPDAGSHFIHSMSEPFSEEDIEDQVMRNWIERFKMNFHQMHASGHINKE